MIDHELKESCINKVKECKQIAYDKLGLKVPPVTIRFDLRGSIAGQANIGSWTKYEPWIRLNEWYLKEYTNDMLHTTIPHEIAHIVADIYFKRDCHHGANWRWVMQSIYKLPPIRTHLFGPSISTRKINYYFVICSNCGFRHRFSEYHRTKILRTGGIARRYCAICKENLAEHQIVLDNG